jgi:hypothetical protein
MIAQKLRQRLVYLAMSAFVAWHTVAMVLAPAPDSEVSLQVRRAMQPYLTFLRLDNQWDFFAPSVGEGSRLRYDLQDKTGKVHVFLPSQELRWYHPSFLWFRSWFYRIMEDPDRFADGAAAYFCRKHAELQPLAITFYDIQEEHFSREDYLAGKQRMDPGFFTIHMLRGMRCPDP